MEKQHKSIRQSFQTPDMRSFLNFLQFSGQIKEN